MYYIKFTIALLSLFTSCFVFSQNPNQPEALKKLKEGEYNIQFIENGKFKKSKKKVKLSYGYDDLGNINTVLIDEKRKYTIAVKKQDGVEEVYTTHFTRRDEKYKEWWLVCLDNQLYQFNFYADGKRIYEWSYSVGSNSAKQASVKAKLEDYFATKVKEQSGVAYDKMRARLAKENPESFYKKVYKESEGLRKVVTHSKKIGFINSNNSVVVETIYDQSFNYFENGVVGVEKDGKQGYVDKAGKVVIPIDNQRVYEVYESYIRVKKNDKYSIYNCQGEKLTKDYTYVGDFDSGKSYFTTGSKIGYFDTALKQYVLVSDVAYDFVKPLGTESLVVGKSGSFGVITIDGKAKTEMKYSQFYKLEDNVCVVKNKSNRYAYYNLAKGFLTEFIFTDAKNLKGQVARVAKGESKGTVNRLGIVKWDDGNVTASALSSSSNTAWKSKYDKVFQVSFNGNYRVKKDGLFGFVDANGKAITPVKYHNAFDYENMDNALVKVAGSSVGCINREGKEVVPLVHSRLLFSGAGYIRGIRNGEYVYYNSKGNLVSEPNKTMTLDFSNDMTSRHKNWAYVSGLNVVEIVLRDKIYNNSKGISFPIYNSNLHKTVHYNIPCKNVSDGYYATDGALMHYLYAESQIVQVNSPKTDPYKPKLIKTVGILDGEAVFVSDLDFGLYFNSKRHNFGLSLWRTPKNGNLYIVSWNEHMEKPIVKLVGENTFGSAKIVEAKDATDLDVYVVYTTDQELVKSHIVKYSIERQDYKIGLTERNRINSKESIGWEFQDATFNVSNKEVVIAYQKNNESIGLVGLFKYDENLSFKKSNIIDHLTSNMWSNNKKKKNPEFQNGIDKLYFDSRTYREGGSNIQLSYCWKDHSIVMLCRPKKDIGTYKVYDDDKEEYVVRKYYANNPTFVKIEPNGLVPVSYTFLNTIRASRFHSTALNTNNLGQFYFSKFYVGSDYKEEDNKDQFYIEFDEKVRNPNRDGITLENILSGKSDSNYHYSFNIGLGKFK